MLIYQIPDNQSIYAVVKVLQQLAHDEWNGEPHDSIGDIPLCEVNRSAHE